MKVRFTLSAQRQLESAVDFIRRDKPGAAVSFAKKAKQRLKKLEPFPNAGRSVPEYPNIQVREVIVSPFRFFYQVREDNIWILAVWHEAQEPSKPNL